MTNQVLEGVLVDGTVVKLADWDAEHSEYDAQGWLERFGARVGSETAAQLPTGAWIDMSKFCIVREAA